jgi:hypothetical protein
VTLVHNLDRSLQPEAIVAVVECNPDEVGCGASHGCTSAAGTEQDFAAAGFDITRLDAALSEGAIYLDHRRPGASAEIQLLKGSLELLDQHVDIAGIGQVARDARAQSRGLSEVHLGDPNPPTVVDAIEDRP